MRVSEHNAFAFAGSFDLAVLAYSRNFLVTAEIAQLCHMFIREKLLSSGFAEEVVEMTLESLREAGYLNDERYAQNFVQAHWEDRSRLRIRTDLEARGVPSQIISEVLRAESEERGSDAEIRQIIKLMKKRKFDPGNASWEEKGKMQAFLYRKGYSQSSVRAAMGAESLDSDGFSV